MSSGKIICVNKKAKFNYQILENFETGIVLFGTEVKSLRENSANLTDSYALIRQGEVQLINLHIPPYGPANQFNHEATRTRKLLMHRKEIDKLERSLNEKGLALMPLKLYFKNGKVKVELALGRGKKLHDKREVMKKRDTDRDLRRIMKNKR